MFGSRKKDALAAAAAAQIALNRIEELETALKLAIEANEALQSRSFLFSIEREGRTNKFTFIRNGKFHQIETMGLLSDDVPGWKEALLG